MAAPEPEIFWSFPLHTPSQVPCSLGCVINHLFFFQTRICTAGTKYTLGATAATAQTLPSPSGLSLRTRRLPASPMNVVPSASEPRRCCPSTHSPQTTSTHDHGPSHAPNVTRGVAGVTPEQWRAPRPARRRSGSEQALQARLQTRPRPPPARASHGGQRGEGNACGDCTQETTADKLGKVGDVNKTALKHVPGFQAAGLGQTILNTIPRTLSNPLVDWGDATMNPPFFYPPQ